MALAAIDSRLSGFYGEYTEPIYSWQDRAIEKIAERVRLDNGASILQSGRIQFGGVMELKANLLNQRVRIQNFGRGQVNEELKRQMR